MVNLYVLIYCKPSLNNQISGPAYFEPWCITFGYLRFLRPGVWKKTPLLLQLNSAREYFEQAGIPQGPTEAEEMDPFQATRDAMTPGKNVEDFLLFPSFLEEKNCCQKSWKISSWTPKSDVPSTAPQRKSHASTQPRTYEKVYREAWNRTHQSNWTRTCLWNKNIKH